MRSFRKYKLVGILFVLTICFADCSRMEFRTNSISDHSFNSKQPDISNLPSSCPDGDPKCLANKRASFYSRKEGEKIRVFENLFASNSNKEVEIVLILDASQSMYENLEEVGENMRPLLSHISNRQWRMVLTTADHGDHFSNNRAQQTWSSFLSNDPRFGKLMRWEQNGRLLNKQILTKQIPHYEKIFRDTLTRENSDCDMPPYCQGRNEQPLRVLKSLIERAKNPSSVHSRFFKPQTDTIAIIITDEDERGQDPTRATTAEDVIKTYEKVFAGQKKQLFGFSISIQDNACYQEEKRNSTASMGVVVGRLADLTLGENFSLCAKDYSQSLARISEKTNRLIENSFLLREIFLIPESVEVSFSPQQPNVTWQLVGRKIVFSDNLKPESEIHVSYYYE